MRGDGKLVLTGVKASIFEKIVEKLENHAEFNSLRFVYCIPVIKLTEY